MTPRIDPKRMNGDFVQLGSELIETRITAHVSIRRFSVSVHEMAES